MTFLSGQPCPCCPPPSGTTDVCTTISGQPARVKLLATGTAPFPIWIAHSVNEGVGQPAPGFAGGVLCGDGEAAAGANNFHQIDAATGANLGGFLMQWPGGPFGPVTGFSPECRNVVMTNAPNAQQVDSRFRFLVTGGDRHLAATASEYWRLASPNDKTLRNQNSVIRVDFAPVLPTGTVRDFVSTEGLFWYALGFDGTKVSLLGYVQGGQPSLLGSYNVAAGTSPPHALTKIDNRLLWYTPGNQGTRQFWTYDIPNNQMTMQLQANVGVSWPSATFCFG